MSLPKNLSSGIALPNPIVAQGKAGNDNNETPGEWYVGLTPSNLKANAPILLFVQGLNSTAQTWWVDNNMYDTAYSAGYQTAFVQLYDAGGTSADMWQNGQLLAQKILEMRTHFHNKLITIVGHSKGGVDAQAALTYYGAWRNVNNVITLSAPHHGTELADLAYSFWAGWLADLLGEQGPGTYSMQTGFMEQFRTETDAKPEASYNDYFTLGGTDWGSWFSSTWMGGLYLSTYGQSDGVVRVSSSRLPEGHEILIGDWNHVSIHTGLTFPTFQDYLTDKKATEQGFIGIQGKIEKEYKHSDQWIQGGKLIAAIKKQVILPIEEDVKELTLDIITTNRLGNVNLVNPTGQRLQAKVHSTKEKKGYFPEAIHNVIAVDHPMAGNWELEIQSVIDDAYVLIAHYDSITKVKIQKVPMGKVQSETGGFSVFYQLTADLTQLSKKSLKATYHVVEAGNRQNTKEWTVMGKADLSKKLTLDHPNKVYNITVDVEGTTVSSAPFKRTMIDSVYTK